MLTAEVLTAEVSTAEVSAAEVWATPVVRRKLRRVGRHAGRKAEWKKAIVRLAEGHSIEFFEGV